MVKPPARRPAKVTYNTVRKIGLALPGVAEGISYGTPSLNVKGKFMLRLREPDVLAIHCDFFERDHRMRTDPDTFFIIEHYREYPAVLIRLSKVRVADLRDLIEQAWRRAAPKKLLAQRPLTPLAPCVPP